MNLKVTSRSSSSQCSGLLACLHGAVLHLSHKQAMTFTALRYSWKSGEGWHDVALRTQVMTFYLAAVCQQKQNLKVHFLLVLRLKILTPSQGHHSQQKLLLHGWFFVVAMDTKPGFQKAKLSEVIVLWSKTVLNQLRNYSGN